MYRPNFNLKLSNIYKVADDWFRYVSYIIKIVYMNPVTFMISGGKPPGLFKGVNIGTLT